MCKVERFPNSIDLDPDDKGVMPMGLTAQRRWSPAIDASGAVEMAPCKPNVWPSTEDGHVL